MLPTHEVDCPSCGRFVYTAISLEDVFPADDGPSGPRVLSDARGEYLLCPHCRARIGLERVEAGAGLKPGGE